MSHLTCTNEPPHAYMTCHTWMSHVAYEYVVSYIWMSHVTFTYIVGASVFRGTCTATDIQVVSHIWISHLTRIWHDMHECVMLHMNESRHTYKWATSRVYDMHECVMLHMNESGHMYGWVMAHSQWVMAHSQWVMAHSHTKQVRLDWELNAPL